MFSKKSHKRKLLISFILVFTVVLIGTVLVCSRISDYQYSSIENFQGSTGDRCITLSWNTIASPQVDHLELTVTRGGTSQIIRIPKFIRSYHFKDGVHGERIDFQLDLVDKDGVHSQQETMSRLFLDWDRIPDLPVIKIETTDGQLPPVTYVREPEYGATITDNDYVECLITRQEKHKKDVHLYGSVRRRGNATAYLDKFSLKLKLDEKANLVNPSKSLQNDKEWCLIPSVSLVNIESGFYVADLCGQEWTPAYAPVNVMLNGDWMGTYYLTETVKKAKNRLDISSHGFIIQNDAYWWSMGDDYFRTPFLDKRRGYTYKYPSASKISDHKKDLIYDYINSFEYALYEDGERYTRFIDLDSFATWLLAHDILGTWDAGGSNIFLYKGNLTDEDWFSTPLKIGPIWDLESCYEQTDDWASIRYQKVAHFNILLQKESFQKCYLEKWDKIAPTLEEKVRSFLQDYSDQYGAAIQESWNLDCSRWDQDYVSFDDRVSEVNSWMTRRVQWMNQQLHP